MVIIQTLAVIVVGFVESRNISIPRSSHSPSNFPYLNKVIVSNLCFYGHFLGMEYRSKSFPEYLRVLSYCIRMQISESADRQRIILSPNSVQIL